MKKTFLSLMLVCCLASGASAAQSVSIVYEEAVPQAAYAARKLGEALAERGYKVKSGRTGYDYLVSLAVHRNQSKFCTGNCLDMD